MSQTYFKENETISSIIDYDFKKGPANSSFNIAYGIDKNFLYGCGISIASILLNNSNQNLIFHVFTDYFGDEEKEKFKALANQYQTQIKVYIVNCEKLKTLPSTKNWSYATYFRFIIADYFFNKTDKVLYLDADIFCKGEIQELIDIDFEGHEIAAVVPEGDKNWWAKRSVSLDTPDLVNGYFNAGFLLINISGWITHDISRKAIEMLGDPIMTHKITHLDQDVLNILLVGKIRFVDNKFNTQYSINYELRGNHPNPVSKKTVFIHYIGPTKPWHDWATYSVSESFITAKDASPWRYSPLLKPQNSNQFRYSAKHYFHQKKIGKGISSYINYYICKISNGKSKK